MNTAGVFSTIGALVIGAVTIGIVGDGMLAFVFGVMIALWPLVISLKLALRWTGYRKAQAALAVGSCVYALWFGLVMLDAFYWHPDAQSGLVVFNVGFYSLPVMIPGWIMARRFARFPENRRLA